MFTTKCINVVCKKHGDAIKILTLQSLVSYRSISTAALTSNYSLRSGKIFVK